MLDVTTSGAVDLVLPLGGLAPWYLRPAEMAAGKKAKREGRPTVRSAPSHEIDRAARRIFTHELPRSWVDHDWSGGDDYGIDYSIEIFDAHLPAAVKFAIQLKGVEKPDVIGANIHFPFPTKNLATFVDTEMLPVFLVVVDTTAGHSYYLSLQEYAEDLPSKWDQQETVVVKVPLANRVSDATAFRVAAEQAQRFVINSHASPFAALQRRVRRLEKLDPRFKILATLTEQGEHYQLVAKVPIRFGITFTEVNGTQLHLLRRGYPVQFKRGEVSFEGMPIFDGVLEPIIEIAAKSDCLMTVEVRRDGQTVRLPNLKATLIRAMAETRIEARCLTAPFDLCVTLTPAEAGATTVSVITQFGLDERWAGRRFNDLPFFADLEAFARACASGCQIRMILHAAGLPDAEIPWETIGEVPDFTGLLELIEIFDVLRRVAEAAKTYPRLPPALKSDEVENAKVLLALLESGEFRGPGEGASFKGETEWSESLHAASPEFAAQVGGLKKWDFFGETLELPIELISFSNAKKKIERLKGGQCRVTAHGLKGSETYVRLAGRVTPTDGKQKVEPKETEPAEVPLDTSG